MSSSISDPRLLPANTTLLQPGSRFFRVSDALNYQVASLQAAGGALQTQITTNANGIAANASDIAANTSNIATNTNAITALQGQVGALTGTLRITLATGTGSYTLTDPRISSQTVVVLMPMTSDAAADLRNIWITVSAGQAVINHPSDLLADRTFQVALIG